MVPCNDSKFMCLDTQKEMGLLPLKRDIGVSLVTCATLQICAQGAKDTGVKCDEFDSRFQTPIIQEYATQLVKGTLVCKSESEIDQYFSSKVPVIRSANQDVDLLEKAGPSVKTSNQHTYLEYLQLPSLQKSAQMVTLTVRKRRAMINSSLNYTLFETSSIVDHGFIQK